MKHKEPSFQEFEKAVGGNGLNGDIIIDVYGSIKVTLFKVFNALVLPETSNRKSFSIFEKGVKENIENCQPISILPVFSKVLEPISYNCLHEYFMKTISVTKINLVFK